MACMRTPKALSISELELELELELGAESESESEDPVVFSVSVLLGLLTLLAPNDLFERIDSSISCAVIRCSCARDATLKTASRRLGAELPQRKTSSSRTLVEASTSSGMGMVP